MIAEPQRYEQTGGRKDRLQLRDSIALCVYVNHADILFNKD